ncbi:hypothetical protein [Alteromonas ponticola]|uniref:Uncharacterized protein n=1 Tax=Alteromonas ponticola TaxID=2720613 RepID=A0ABX1R4R0_9ALTE|nr:hypothetical protein [Alteromonas ponticola]NMH61430.1 hypothetical protein [Alteromonas ponticola]
MLPECIEKIVKRIQIQPFQWRGTEWRVPKFQVYAILQHPVAERFVYHEQQKVAILSLGKYDVPLFDPCHHDMESMPAHAVVLSHTKGNRFGLFAYPADLVLKSFSLPNDHTMISKLR